MGEKGFGRVPRHWWRQSRLPNPLDGEYGNRSYGALEDRVSQMNRRPDQGCFGFAVSLAFAPLGVPTSSQVTPDVCDEASGPLKRRACGWSAYRFTGMP